MVAWVFQDVGATVEPLTSAEWTGLLESAGLGEVTVSVRSVDVRDEAKGILRRYGCARMLGIWRRTLAPYLRYPAYRRFVKQVRQQGLTPEGLDEYFGYGLFVGQKPIRE